MIIAFLNSHWDSLIMYVNQPAPCYELFIWQNKKFGTLLIFIIFDFIVVLNIF